MNDERTKFDETNEFRICFGKPKITTKIRHESHVNDSATRNKVKVKHKKWCSKLDPSRRGEEIAVIGEHRNREE